MIIIIHPIPLFKSINMNIEPNNQPAIYPPLLFFFIIERLHSYFSIMYQFMCVPVIKDIILILCIIVIS